MELVDFYDFSSSYPELEGEDVDADTELANMTRKVHLADDDMSLVLPSGAVIGHRDLKRYYNQRFKPEDVSMIEIGDRVTWIDFLQNRLENLCSSTSLLANTRICLVTKLHVHHHPSDVDLQSQMVKLNMSDIRRLSRKCACMKITSLEWE